MLADVYNLKVEKCCVYSDWNSSASIIVYYPIGVQQRDSNIFFLSSYKFVSICFKDGVEIKMGEALNCKYQIGRH